MKKCLSVGLLVSLCMIHIVGCGNGPGPVSAPPISVTFRSSLLDWGNKVMQITNRSAGETLVLQVHVENKGMRQEASISKKVGPGETIELGILEMGWTFVKGETYSIRADGYGLPYTGTVP